MLHYYVSTDWKNKKSTEKPDNSLTPSEANPKMNTTFSRPSTTVLKKTRNSSLSLLKTWKVFLKRLPPVLPGSTSWKVKEESSAQSSTLTIALPNLNLTTFMDANTLLLMVSTEPPMSWSVERKSSSSDTAMSEKAVPNLWEDQVLEFTLPKSTPSVLFKHVWKDMKSFF